MVWMMSKIEFFYSLKYLFLLKLNILCKQKIQKKVIINKLNLIIRKLIKKNINFF